MSPGASLLDMALANGARAYGRHIVPPGGKLALEQLLTHPDLFGLETATNLQRAICRASDGLPMGDLWADPVVREAFGGARPPEVQPETFAIFAAIRGGKSKLAAARAIQATQECDLGRTGIGDRIAIPCLSTNKSEAANVFKHVCENVLAKPGLRPLLVREPTAESIWLRHPSGAVIEIAVTAIARHGSTLIGRWLAGCIFDEAPRMVGEADGVRNLEDSRAAIGGRMLKGSAVWIIGSPWASFGPAYELDKEHFAKPTEKVVVVRAPGHALNPHHWTPEVIKALEQSNPDAYVTNCLARFLDSAGGAFSLSAIERSTRAAGGDLEPNPLQHYVAAIDPATRRNHWTLVVATRSPGPNGLRDRVVLTREWKPRTHGSTSRLDPGEVFADLAALLKPYGVTALRTDQWSTDALQVIARQHGLTLVEEQITGPRKLDLLERLRIRLENDELELSADPRISADLMRIRKVVTQTGVRIDTPETADGGHCDMAMALALVFGYGISDPRPEPVKQGSPEWFEQIVDRDRDALIKARAKKNLKQSRLFRRLGVHT